MNGNAVLGFDFPIGLPAAYARQVGIESFPQALTEFGIGRWKDFYNLAARATEISLHRPFYPLRPGGPTQADLVRGLGVPSIADLRRRCDQPYSGRGAACALFWTLGGNQVGRAAVTGWRDLLAPPLTARDLDIALWPFDGDLTGLSATRACVIVRPIPSLTSV